MPRLLLERVKISKHTFASISKTNISQNQSRDNLALTLMIKYKKKNFFTAINTVIQALSLLLLAAAEIERKADTKLLEYIFTSTLKSVNSIIKVW